MKTNKVSRQSRARKVLHGVNLHLASVATLKIGGEDMATADFEKKIQAAVDSSDAAVTAKAAARAAIEAETKAYQSLEPLLRLFKKQVIGQYGDGPAAGAVLADFGYQPRKVVVHDTATKTLAVAKTKATRAARHTVGPRQKAMIKGVVTPEPAPPPQAPATNVPPNGGLTHT